VIASTQLFPPELLDDMTAPFLAGQASEEVWLTVEEKDGPVAVAYVAPERMTSGTANLLLIAVHASRQGGGLGAALLAHLEGLLAERGDRLLLVETSGLPDFERTRAFYLANGYEQEARIRDFYQAGEDKIVFRKPLA
jgi:ribosomal protein S18 acetylase RimI-like enzyme